MRIALVTCGQLPAWEVDDRPLHEAFGARGLAVVHARWDDPAVDWAAFDGALVRTTWDYHRRRDEFLAWIVRAARATRLANPPAILRWNTHKSYLRELEGAGVRIVPTVWIERGSAPDLARLLAQRGWTRAFLKPFVGATAHLTLRFDATAAGCERARAHLAAVLPADGMLLQPYQHSVEREGELSAIVIDGELTHGVRKVPVAGDYRVQDDFGAADEPFEFLPDEREAIARVVAAVESRADLWPAASGRHLPYARVDFLRGDDGGLALNELELVEPSLFFRHRESAAECLAAAFLRYIEVS